MNGPSRLFLFGLAALFTLLNAVKPLQIDDTAYYYYAAHVAEHPLDPYGFTIFWYQHPEPANAVLAPPLLPYWWAPALHLFGDRPFFWKLWLLPFSWGFVAALARLLHRFARGLERPLLLLTVLSPAFLPSFNLMLDVPALALGLLALALFFEACDRAAVGPAVLAGLLAGLAAETKYTALLVPAVMALYAILFRRIPFALVAISVTGAVFAGWEGLMTWRYGVSHFLIHLRENQSEAPNKLVLLPPLLADLGGVAPALALLALAALRRPVRRVALAGAVAAVPFLLVAGVPEPYASRTWYLGREDLYFRLSETTFASLGLGVAVLVACAGGVLLWRRRPALRTLRAPQPAWFLGLWLLLEVAGCLVVTPFPAVRRLLGLLIVATLLVGRLTSRTCRTGSRRALVWAITAGGVGLGLLFYGVDLRDACARKQAAEAAAAQVWRQPHGTIWYVGHWGFQYYAERAGLVAVVPDASQLRAGDWLIVPDDRLVQQVLAIPAGATEEPLAPVAVGDWLPLRTVQCFHGGFTPLEHQEGPRVTVRLYRVTRDFVPASRF